MGPIGGAQPRPVAWRTMTSVAGSWALFGYGFFQVFEKETGAFVGRVGTHQPDGWPGTEVGWALTRAVQGRGYATEAASAAMDWAFDHLGWSEVIHCIAPENAPSIAVAKRLGSRLLRAAMLPPPISRETHCYGQSRDEWRAKRRSQANP